MAQGISDRNRRPPRFDGQGELVTCKFDGGSGGASAGVFEMGAAGTTGVAGPGAVSAGDVSGAGAGFFFCLVGVWMEVAASIPAASSLARIETLSPATKSVKRAGSPFLVILVLEVT